MLSWIGQIEGNFGLATAGNRRAAEAETVTAPAVPPELAESIPLEDESRFTPVPAAANESRFAQQASQVPLLCQPITEADA